MKSIAFTLLFASFAFVQACGNQSTNTEPAKTEPVVLDPATSIYINGDIVTMDEQRPSAEAIAVRAGNILAVGSKAEVEAVAGTNLETIDLEGHTLLPGLIDAHGHVSFTAVTLGQANVSSPPVGSANTIDDAIQILRDYADQNPDEQWIQGWGYDDSLLAEKRHLTRADLDKVSSERPIAVRHVSGHFMACNSKCLELAGISANSPDPDGGVIRRIKGSQEPDGVLEETAAHPLHKVIAQPSGAKMLALVNKSQNYYASYGITTIQDGAAQLEAVELLRTAAKQGLLNLDVVMFPYVSFLKDGIESVQPSQDYEDHVRIGGIKLVLDGSPQGKTAFMTKPYLHPPHGQKQGYVGYPTFNDELVNEYVDTAFANNINVMAHANGDAAADQLIKAVAAANEKHGNADRRTVMIHAQTVREDQIDSMLELDIMPSYFSAHTFYWGDWHRDSVFGVERASRISPLRSSADKGLRYTTHNDTPIVPPDMMRLVWASVNRITRSGKVLGEAQRATPMEALKSITIDAAHQYFEEDRKGSITAGKLADLVILSSNPLKVEPLAIKDIEVLKTIKEGKVVFSK